MSRPQLPPISQDALRQLGGWSGVFGDRLLDAVLELAQQEPSRPIAPELVQQAVSITCDRVKNEASVQSVERARNVKPAAA